MSTFSISLAGDILFFVILTLMDDGGEIRERGREWCPVTLREWRIPMWVQEAREKSRLPGHPWTCILLRI